MYYSQDPEIEAASSLVVAAPKEFYEQGDKNTKNPYEGMSYVASVVLRNLVGVKVILWKVKDHNRQFHWWCETKDGEVIVIEMNPRVSRSSALASKATGFPIAKIAALLAVGYTLDEITNDITGKTPACFEPTIDYVVTKIPRFAFEKFPGSESTLTTSMKSVGEAMAIGRNFKESLQKALVSLETGFSGLDRVLDLNKKQIEKKLKENIPNKILLVGEALRKKINIKKNKFLNNELLRPTKIYVKEILNLTKYNLINGCANITGGGISDNIKRFLSKFFFDSV